MAGGEGINHELSLGEVITKTFELYRKNFMTYLVLFLVIEAVFALLSAAVVQVVNLPSLGTNPTSQQVASWVSGSLGTLIVAGLALLILAVVVFPIAEGATIKMASDEIQNRTPQIMTAVSFAASKLLSMWALGILLSVIVFIGFIALIIPGIILAIMFSLVLPALLIENTGVLGSMNRSRELVSHRWLKTFVTGLVLVIFVALISAVLGLVAIPFGPVSGFVSSVLGAFSAPIIPIAMTVYYYSNLARITPAPLTQIAGTQPTMAPPGLKYCSNCGTQLVASARFCSNCGAKQPA